jgi:3-oxoacyl-[acyl-carrier-protein] synthase II
VLSPLITGTGLITPLGGSVDATWEALLAGRCISDHAQVSPQFAGKYSRASRLAIDAALQAIGHRSDLRDDPQTALVVATSKGPVEEWLKAPSTLSDLEAPGSFGLGQVATDLARELDLVGPRLTLSSACVSGLHALIRAAMLIGSGEARRVLVVAAEASVHPLFIASFKRLGVLPPEGFGCRPFDRSRQGFLMSEAAAAVLLEADGHRPGLVMVDRFALGCDAFHLTGSDPEGRVLRSILARTSGSLPFDLLHGHGTGTPVNDEVELRALGDCCGGPDRLPTLYSHKGALGHSLGAAGLVSVVLNVKSHQTGIVPPNVQTTEPLPTDRLEISRHIARRPIRRSLAVAAGFGGGIAAVALRSCVAGESM